MVLFLFHFLDAEDLRWLGATLGEARTAAGFFHNGADRLERGTGHGSPSEGTKCSGVGFLIQEVSFLYLVDLSGSNRAHLILDHGCKLTHNLKTSEPIVLTLLSEFAWSQLL